MNLREIRPSHAGLKESGRVRAWLYVVIMMVLILISLPLTPVLWRAGTQTFGPAFNLIGYLTFIVIAIGFGIFLLRLRRKSGIVHVIQFCGLTLVYLYLLKYQCRFPAERLHLLEYGLLASLSYRAFRFSHRRTNAYVLGFVLSSAFGFADEAVQFLLPNRVFEFRDVLTNVLASVLGLVVTALFTSSALTEEGEK